ncbi:MAG: phosphotransferase [Thermodesulfobacteriota bacterium]
MDRINSGSLSVDDIVSVAWMFDIGKVVDISRYGGGRINETFLVQTLAGPGEKKDEHNYVLQKLHRIFSPLVLTDMDVITNRLEAAGLSTPKLVRTLTEELGITLDGSCWRMLTYIPGMTCEKGITARMAKEAASLVGRFHNALYGLDYEFLHKIPGFHDTEAIMTGLDKTACAYRGTEKYSALFPLAERVLAEYQNMEKSLQKLPDRVIHGDLKLNNVRFDESGQEAVCLLDLDTLGRDKVVIDIGDAVRSWCGSSEDGEEGCKEEGSRFDLGIFQSMMEGYIPEAAFLSGDEKAAISEGVATVTLELSARFITDAFEETYFTLDRERYPSLYEQNRAKATAQMQFYDDFQKHRTRAEQFIAHYM